MEFKYFQESQSIVNPLLKFKDISGKKYRIYHFDKGEELIINNPIALNISDSGGHRIIDGIGRCYYISPKWLWIEWEPKEGEPSFKF
jgi:hypothetical protein